MNRLILFGYVMTILLAGCTPEPNAEATSASQQQEETPAPVAKTVVLPDSSKLLGYEQLFINAGLVDVQTLDNSIQVELKYSTTDNFLQTDVYGELTRCYLLPEVAQRLAKAQRNLSQSHPGYHLRCYDCARPRRVQYVMWDLVKMPNKKDYVASPAEGSIHNFGAAVDLTVVDERDVPLDMGTAYDFFGPLAWPDKEAVHLASGELTREQHANRLILRKAMQNAGFSRIHTEWWHFNAWKLEVVKERYKIIE